MIEHYAGVLPFWLAPVQAIVLPVADRFNEAGEAVVAALGQAGLRAEVDARSESVGRKIRDAELRKVPYMLVLGEREAAEGTVSVRSHGGADRGPVAVGELAGAGRARACADGLKPLRLCCSARHAPGALLCSIMLAAARTTPSRLPTA